MKEHKQPQQEETQNPYWKSLEQWRRDPEFEELMEKEFMTSPLQSADGQDGWARREFLKVMGAGIALTSFGCVRRPEQRIIPYANKPPEIIHGRDNHYASSYNDGSEGFGIVVTTKDGRPIKIEGNPQHPNNQGGMSARAHSHVLDLYDPDRLTGPQHLLQNKNRTNFEGVGVKWEDLDKAVVDQLKKGSVAIIAQSQMSPSTKALMQEFASSFGGNIVYFDTLSAEAIRAAQNASYGRDIVPQYRFDKAEYIVAVDCDFLGTWLTPTEFNRQFGKSRKPGATMSKLVAFESLMSLTGTNADERFRIRPSQQVQLLQGLLHELIVVQKKSRYAGDSAVAGMLKPFKGVEALPRIAKELWDKRGSSLVVAGTLAADSQNAVGVQVLVNLLNSALENDGKTIDHSQTLPKGFQGSYRGLANLQKDLEAGKIKTVIMHQVNPVYALPENSGFAAALGKAEMVISTADRVDESTRYADYVVTDHHILENWGDLETNTGVYSIQQPTIMPLYNTRAFQDSMMTWLKGAGKGSARVKAASNWPDFLKDYWKTELFSKRTGELAKGSFEDFWVALLQNGVMNTNRSADTAGSARSFSAGSLKEVKAATAVDGYELALYATVGLKDGTLANVSWLQEFPDPVAKICWDNYACFSPKDATREKIKSGTYVQLKVNGQTLEVPAHVQPGQADGVIGLAIGYGRKAVGRVGNNVGVKAINLATWKEGILSGTGSKVEMKVLGKREAMASTQGHHSMEGRQIVVEETLAQYMKKPGSTIHRHKIFSMWTPHQYTKNKWGMTIDLNSCTGCGACVIACQSENNVPVVGKKYVERGREMHWIRVDRYYVGNPENPDTVHQPLPCMHCDNAPCETVCPVAATTHSDEGTNDMIYNRCVGTRYCSNNCPYKVRRFNWFDYTEIDAPKELVLNPDVTVRNRGVMEKCTFCIHRIRAVKLEHKASGKPLRDGDVQVACAQSCPTKAITFGDLNDPNSEVLKHFNAQNAYALLEELNTKPAVHYQTKVRNVAELQGRGGHHGDDHHKGDHKNGADHHTGGHS